MPEQILRESLIRIYTVCHSFCMFHTYYCIRNPNCSLVSESFRCPFFSLYEQTKLKIKADFPRYRTQIFSTSYPVNCVVYAGYYTTSDIECGSSSCTFDNPLAKARGLSLRTGRHKPCATSHLTRVEREV